MPPSAPMTTDGDSATPAASNGDAPHAPLPSNRSVGILALEAGMSDMARTRSFAKLRTPGSHGDLARRVDAFAGHRPPPAPPAPPPPWNSAHLEHVTDIHIMASAGAALRCLQCASACPAR